MITINLSKEITCDAEKAWELFGGSGFADIQKWNSAVKHSEAIGPAFGEAPCTARKVQASGITLTETFISYSKELRKFTYNVTGMPWIVSRAINAWHIDEDNENNTVLRMELNVEVQKGLGWLLNPVVKVLMTKQMKSLMRQFKTYMEADHN